jgi:formyl-CoA transferase
MGKALEGIRILDMTHVQSGPTCTQILAWFGADVIKVERPGVGDPTRGQLRDKPGVDSLYFTMLNSNKRGITLNPKTAAGKKIFTKLIRECDVMVENFAPGAIDRMGFPWDIIQKLNPRLIYASVKGFGPGPFEDLKVYENVAQCTGGAASTTGEIDDTPLVTGAQIGDSGTGIHLVAGILAALIQRERTGRGQRVTVAMQDAVLNLCRVKLRDQQRLSYGPLKEYPQYPNGTFGAAVPRAGNASGGGHPGWTVKCKGWETDPDAYIYVIAQAQQRRHIHDGEARLPRLRDPRHQLTDAACAVLGLLHSEHDEVERAWIDRIGGRRGELSRKLLRGNIEQAVASFDWHADDCPFAVDQIRGGPRADKHHAMPGHQQLGREQRAVGRPEHEHFVVHQCS